MLPDLIRSGSQGEPLRFLRPPESTRSARSRRAPGWSSARRGRSRLRGREGTSRGAVDAGARCRRTASSGRSGSRPRARSRTRARAGRSPDRVQVAQSWSAPAPLGSQVARSTSRAVVDGIARDVEHALLRAARRRRATASRSGCAGAACRDASAVPGSRARPDGEARRRARGRRRGEVAAHRHALRVALLRRSRARSHRSSGRLRSRRRSARRCAGRSCRTPRGAASPRRARRASSPRPRRRRDRPG